MLVRAWFKKMYDSFSSIISVDQLQLVFSQLEIENMNIFFNTTFFYWFWYDNQAIVQLFENWKKILYKWRSLMLCNAECGNLPDIWRQLVQAFCCIYRQFSAISHRKWRMASSRSRLDVPRACTQLEWFLVHCRISTISFGWLGEMLQPENYETLYGLLISLFKNEIYLICNWFNRTIGQ